MCLTVPCLVTAVNGAVATVARGDERIEVSLLLMDEPVAAGDWLAVQAQRYGLRRMDAQEAEEVLRLYASLAVEEASDVSV